MHVLILGAGAVGGYIGAKLLAAGAHVVSLARGRRLAKLSDRALIIHSPLGAFAAPVRHCLRVPAAAGRRSIPGSRGFLADLAEHMRPENEVLFPIFEPGGRSNG